MIRQDPHTALVDPKLLDSVQGLQLISRVLSEELLAGANISRKTGIGLEFSQYRSYEPGDDLRLLDWKLFARTERYYVRQAVVYSNIHVRFLLDNTASMKYAEDGISKKMLSSVVIATLAHLAWKSGDQFSLTMINGPATGMAGNQKHLNRILYLLNSSEASGVWPDDININHWSRTLNKEFIILLTDLYQENSEIEELLKKIKLPGNEVIIFTVSGEKEKTLDYNKPLHFHDLENNKVLKTDPAQVKKQYLQNRKKYFNSMQEKLNSLNIPLYELVLNESPAKALRQFLSDRTYLHL